MNIAEWNYLGKNLQIILEGVSTSRNSETNIKLYG